MLRLFYPYEYVSSVFDIDYQKLYQQGYRAVMFDIDNTLVPHGKDSTPDVDALFDRIHQVGLQTFLLSNNSEERIQRCLRNIDSQYLFDAQKPKPANYLRAVQILGVKKEEVLFVGDQIFTDILGANLAGIDNILVAYIRRKDETKIGIRRNLEKIVLKCYSISKRYQHRLGAIEKKEKV